MGGVSRAKFYADILPLLETVKLGSRNFVVVASMDRLIEANRVQGRLMTTKAPCGADTAPVGRIDDDDAPKPGRRGRTSDAGLSQRGICEGRQ
jgi:hypothetical protein